MSEGEVDSKVLGGGEEANSFTNTKSPTSSPNNAIVELEMTEAKGGTAEVGGDVGETGRKPEQQVNEHVGRVL